MSLRVIEVPITTDASGNAVVETEQFQGRIISIYYPGGLAATVDLTVTTKETGQTILSVSNVAAADIWRPTVPVDDSAGAEIAGQNDFWTVTGEALEFTIAQGGDTQQATLRLMVEN